ncbi:hypothetical protein EHP00_2366 [Ecytonucleospora hepatopenaei]|uniref:Uncharacterized protein n=1 Tax=Ecytonucleospora hepatopenaei TaxID=646526 RepID=A0A1W0E7Q7_9MICR|nr:hypothetical protein EHP00_2366 [Ecytonucleospora hepatopenaei]
MFLQTILLFVKNVFAAAAYEKYSNEHSYDCYDEEDVSLDIKNFFETDSGAKIFPPTGKCHDEFLKFFKENLEKIHDFRVIEAIFCDLFDKKVDDTTECTVKKTLLKLIQIKLYKNSFKDVEKSDQQKHETNLEILRHEVRSLKEAKQTKPYGWTQESDDAELEKQISVKIEEINKIKLKLEIITIFETCLKTIFYCLKASKIEMTFNKILEILEEKQKTIE